MNTEKNTSRSRRATTLTGLLALLASVLVLSGAFAAPAQATDTPSSQSAQSLPSVAQAAAGERYGYLKVVTPESYLKAHVAKGVQILHIDTEHATPDGFWFAAKSGLHKRSFGWSYQPYGMWCDGDAMVVSFNGWMNTHWCGIDRNLMTAKYGPVWAQNTDACVARTRLPWKEGSPFDGDESYCGDEQLNWDTVPILQEASSGNACAPWEDQGLTTSGGPKCALQHYDWENGPANTFWAPAPDTCTQMPATSNKTETNPNPASYVPASGDGTCTGEALAPNCSESGARSLHQGCSGVAEVAQQWVSRTRTMTATGVSGTATQTRDASANAVVATVTKTYKKKYKGKTYKATASVSITKSASATRSATITVNGSASATATMSCSGIDVDTARACADAKAETEALRIATETAGAQARSLANTQAVTAAKAAAEAAAAQAASSQTATAAEKKAAAKQAKAQAKKKVAAAIKAAKRRR